MKHVIRLLSVTAAFTALQGEEPSKADHANVRTVKAFAPGQVRLLDSPFRKAMEAEGRYILSLDPDRLLHTFRLTAGLPSTAEKLAGWEAPDCGLRGHFSGHYLSACALMYRATGDTRYRDRAERMVSALSECQRALGTGYLSAFPSSDFDKLETEYRGVWAPYYTIHKLMAGLLDVYEFCGDMQALETVRRMADYFRERMAKLSPERIEKVLSTTGKAPQNEFGGMSEVLHRLFAITGRREDLELANLFDRSWIVDPMALGKDTLDGLHANTHAAQALGWWSRYRDTGETRYRDAARFFWQQVARHRSYVEGGNSDREHFFPLGEESRRLSPSTAETCNVYNMLKLTGALFQETPDPELGDYYEKALFNHILASIEPEDGSTIYFLPLQAGRFKVYGSPLGSFWCCNGTGMENPARYGEAIYFHGPDSLWVNLYIASEVEWKDRGVRVRQETSFPAREGTKFHFTVKTPTEFTLNLRIPRWAANGVSLSMNGKPLENSATPGSFLALKRIWRDGDTLELVLPMALRTHHAVDDPKQVAFLYGPIVLAGELGREGYPRSDRAGKSQHAFDRFPLPVIPFLVGADPDRPGDWMKPVPGKPLTFRTSDTVRPGDLVFSPLYAIHHQRYAVYWKFLTPDDWDRSKSNVPSAPQKEKTAPHHS